ncbi:MAG: hypothetical protein DHS20C14_13210 [Phycisphaeraceae bacterium]|nr:MAG: hypothetical protein DHS20C14_13210 [Phycisphaeraceae bacterium]
MATDGVQSEEWQTSAAISVANPLMHNDSKDTRLRFEYWPGDTFYIAVDGLGFIDEGADTLELGYPAPPMGLPEDALPDEVGTVTGLGLADGTGTLALFAAVPWDNWHELTGEHALAHLPGPAGESISLSFDSDTSALNVRVTSSEGSTILIPLRRASSQGTNYCTFRGGGVAVALSIAGNGIYVAANLQGELATGQIGIPGGQPFGPLDTLELATSADGSVGAFDFYGYRVDPWSGSIDEVTAALRDASGIGTAGDCAACPADFNGDGQLNVDDVDAFVLAFVSSDLAADLDANGSLNVDDIDAFVGSFLSGC